MFPSVLLIGLLKPGLNYLIDMKPEELKRTFSREDWRDDESVFRSFELFKNQFKIYTLALRYVCV